MSVLLLTMGPQLGITADLPVVAVGGAGVIRFRAVGATGPVKWTLVDSTLPPEWDSALNPDGNAVTLTTADAETAGTFSITVRAVDNARIPVVRSFGVRVMALPLTISGAFPEWYFGVPATGELTISGGVPPYSLLPITSGALPSGVSLSIVGNQIVASGAPTVAGPWSATVSASDADTVIASLDVSGNVVVLYDYIDDYAAPLRCYGLSRLIRGYFGPVLRVRRSSDNAEADIGFSGHGIDVAALLSHVGASDGHVVTWYDQVGQSNLTQASLSLQPTIVDSGVYLGAVRGTTAWGLQTMLPAGGDTRTVCMRAKINSSGSGTTYNIYTSAYYESGKSGVSFYYDPRSSANTPGYSFGVSYGTANYWVYGSALDLTSNYCTITARHKLTSPASDTANVRVNGAVQSLNMQHGAGDVTSTFSSGTLYVGLSSLGWWCSAWISSFVVFGDDITSVVDQVEALL